MRKELQAKSFNEVAILLIVIGIIFMILRTILINKANISFETLRVVRTISWIALGIGGFMLLLSRIIFPFYHLIKKAIKPGVGYEKRISLLTKSIEIEPTIEAYLERAQAKMFPSARHNNWGDSGLKDCNWVIDKNPNIVRAYILKSWFLTDLGKKKEAVECLDIAILLHPTLDNENNLSPYFSRGWLNMDLKNYEAAKNDFRQSLEQKEAKRTTSCLLATVEEKLGNYENAVNRYSDFLNKYSVKGLDGDAQILAYVRRTNIFLKEGRLEDAKNEWKKYKESGLGFPSISGFSDFLSAADFEIKKQIEDKLKESK